MKYRLFLILSYPLLLLADDVIELKKIEVEDRYGALEEQKESSIAKRIVASGELVKYGDINAFEVLKRTPGVTVAEGGSKKGPPGKGYTKVLVDGEELLGSRRSNPLEQISADAIERIEIITNGSAEYSAESMGGVVNIVLKKPAFNSKTDAKLSGGAIGGEPTVLLYLKNEAKIEKLAYSFDVTCTDNSQDAKSTTTNSSYDEDTKNKSHSRSLGASGKLIYTKSPTLKYLFDAAFQGLEDDKSSVAVRSGGVNKTIFQDDNGGGFMQRAKLALAYNTTSDSLLELKLKYHHDGSHGEQTSEDSGVSRGQESKASYSMYGTEALFSAAIHEHFIKSGVEIKRLIQYNDIDDYVNAILSSSTNQRMGEERGSFFIQDEIAIKENLVFTTGVRYEHSVRKFDGEYVVDFLAPSVHLLYKIGASDSIRASIARTMKLPRLDEMTTVVSSSLNDNDINHPDRVGNQNLKEEEALSYELRYEHFFDKRGIVSLSAFYRNIDDKIEKLTTYESGRYVERPYNVGRGMVVNVEAEIKKPLDIYSEGLSMFANVSFYETKLDTGDGVDRNIRGTSKYLCNIGIDQILSSSKTSYGIVYRYNGGYDDPQDLSGVAEKRDPYGVLDLYATKQLNSMYKLGVNLKNLTTNQIATTTKRYVSGVLDDIQVDKEYSQFQLLVTLSGRW